MTIDVEERVERAEAYFLQGYNCCQSVVLAFSDFTGIDEDSLKRLSIGHGAGVGRLREVCGTVSGMAMIAGCLTDAEERKAASRGMSSDGRAEEQVTPQQLAARRKQAAYTLVQELAGIFREENGSIVCRELTGLREQASMSPVPQERNEAYYKARPCRKLIGCSARILAQYIEKNF